MKLLVSQESVRLILPLWLFPSFPASECIPLLGVQLDKLWISAVWVQGQVLWWSEPLWRKLEARLCPFFPLELLLNWEFSTAPTCATLQLWSSYIYIWSCNSMNLTWTLRFGFLAWPWTCLTTADLLISLWTRSWPRFAVICPASFTVKSQLPHAPLSHSAHGSPCRAELYSYLPKSN